MDFLSPGRARGDVTIELFEPHGFDEAAFLERFRDPRITARDVGRCFKRLAIRNTITYTGVASALTLWAQNAGVVATDYRIAQLAVGTNATPPSRGDTSLGAPVGGSGVKTLADVNRTVSAATGELIISVSFGTGDANVGPALSLREAGLILGNGSLGMRQVNPGVPKTSAFIAGYTWRIALTT